VDVHRKHQEGRTEMRIARNGEQPQIADTAIIAASAQLIGNIRVGAGCYIDHQVVLEASGPPVEIGDDAIVLAGTVIRSVGGRSRPAFSVEIGRRTLIAPHCTLTGCRLGSQCYVATGVIVLQGASIGDHSRIGVGAIIHATAIVPERARIGMRHIAVPHRDGLLDTADVDLARQAVSEAGFFTTAFGLEEVDQSRLHDQVVTKLLDEVRGWRDKAL
jgi:carbonic anhydrase/acetyltransferase-like protein (isoleucine patch superfamily)